MLCGPAASGKTTFCLKAYARALKNGPGGRAMFIAPASRVCDWIKQMLVLEHGVRAAISPGVVTFHELTTMILRGQGIRELSNTGRTFLLTKVLTELRKEGRLEYFSNMTEFTGFVVAVERLISELKEGEYLPEDFERAVSRRNSPKDRCVLEIFRRYQDKLQKENLFDTAGRQFCAVRTLRDSKRIAGMDDSLDVLMVDGFHNFTPVQLHIVEILSGRAKESCITLPYRKKEGGIFEPARKTYDALVGMGFAPEELGEAAVKPRVCVLETPDVWRETVEIAREARTLIMRDGIRPSEICVAFRDADEDGTRMKEALDLCGVPCALGPEIRIVRSPVVSNLIASVSAEIQSMGGKRTASDYLETFKKRAAELRRARELQEPGRIRLAQRSLRALEGFERALGQVTLSASYTGIAGREMTPAEFLGLFRPAIESSKFREDPYRGDRVLISGVHEVRQLRFRVLFLGGLGFGIFPRHYREEPIYSDRERQELNKPGNITLEERLRVSSEEEFLFYMARTRASEKLYLSYSQTDRTGRQILRSYMLDEYLKALGSGGFEERRYSAADAVPAPERISSIPDFLQHMVISGKSLSPPALPGKAKGWEESFASTMAFTERAVKMIKERRKRDSQEAFGGNLNNPLIKKSLNERFGKEKIFPVTSLDSYVKCPFRYYCSYVLELVQPVTVEDEMEPRVAGDICHRTLFRLFSMLKERMAKDGMGEEAMEYGIRRLEGIIREETQRCVRDRPGAGRFLDIELLRLQGVLEKFIRWHAENDAGTRPLYLELGFGLTGKGAAPGKTAVSCLELKEGVKVSGKIDRIDSDSKSRLVVMDYKRGQAPSVNAMNEGSDIQLPLYVIAAEMALKQLGHEHARISRARYISLSRPVRTALDLDGGDGERGVLKTAADKASAAVAAIRNGVFTVPADDDDDRCRKCDFGRICRHSHGAG